MSIADRFWSKVNRRSPEECWEWAAGRTRFGYGVFWVSSQQPCVNAHRYAYEMTHGPIPVGQFVCHRCDNPPCVNPAHMFLGSAAENMFDRHKKGRYATGAESWSATHPDRVARGDRHGTRTQPQRIPKGERNGMAKLTAAQVEHIKERLAEGKSTHRQIADDFGVDRTTITAINRGKNWGPR